MVLVDIYVPSVNNIYDFQLDENVKIETVIDEISDLVEQKERCHIVGNRRELLLCLKKSEQILDKNKTLAEYQVVAGDSMILV